MNKAEFLRRVAKEARGSLSPQLTQELLLEVSAHLDDSIQARLELGDGPEMAELNAIVGFASPESFVHRMEEVHDQSSASDKPLLAFGLALILLISFSFDLAFSGIGRVASLLLALGLVGAIFVRSSFLPSPKWKTLKQLGVASVVLIGVFYPLMILNLWAYGGMGYIPAGSVQSYIADRKAEIAKEVRLEQDQSWFESYRPIQEPADIQQSIDAATEASKAPVWQRYSASAKVATQMIVITFGFISIFHLLPVAVRRRWRRARRRTGWA